MVLGLTDRILGSDFGSWGAKSDTVKRVIREFVGGGNVSSLLKMTPRQEHEPSVLLFLMS